MSDSQRRRVDWASLPPNILQNIAFSVSSFIDLLRFRAVCQKWRSANLEKYPVSTYSLIPYLPKQIPTPPCSIFIQSPRPVFLVVNSPYIIKPLNPNLSPKAWFVSVEELNRPRLRVRFPLTNQPIQDLPKGFPKFINIVDYIVKQIGEGFKLCFSNGSEDVFRFEGFQPCCNYPTKSKVVHFDDGNSPHKWSVMVLLLNQGGVLGSLKFNGEWKFIDYGPGFHFDDVMYWGNGKLIGIDRRGAAYFVNGSESRVIERICDPICVDECPQPCFVREGRKFLGMLSIMVVMIARKENRFEVYCMDRKNRRWIIMDDIGDWVLIMMFDNVYAVKAKEIPGCRGNCILFPKNMFCLHSWVFYEDYELFEGVSKYKEVGVYYLDEDHCRLASSDPALAELFWPCPPWLLPADRPDSDSSTRSDDDYDDISSLPMTSMSSSDGEVSPASSQYKEDTRAVRCVSQSSSHGNESQHDIPDENKTESLPVPVDSCRDEVVENIASIEGAEVSPEFLPVLQKIWARHGNLIPENKIRSKGLVKWGLESLAKMIIILQGDTITSLSESEIEFLKSTLVDLQSLNFRVDWLVPFVERVVALQKSKQQVDTEMELETKRAKLLIELHELEGKLADQKKLVVEMTEPLALEKSASEEPS